MGSKTKQQQHKDREVPHNVCLLTQNGAEWLFGNYFWFLCFSLKVNLFFFMMLGPKIKACFLFLQFATVGLHLGPLSCNTMTVYVKFL